MAARKGPARARPLDLGPADWCLNVKDLGRSLDFYERLGFRKVGGKRKERWLILTNATFRIGLYQGWIPDNVLNFRGGDVAAIVRALKRRGLQPYDIKIKGDDGAGRALLKDPDGNVIFFDTTPSERKEYLRSNRKR